MDFFTFVGIILIIYYLVYLVLLCVVDCDLTLFFADKLGRNLNKLHSKVVWVTGASSGIGEAIAFEVARQGGKLILTARRSEELLRVKNKCLELNRQLTPKDILVLPLDVTKVHEHQQAFDQAVHHFGTLDILVNNAGRTQRAIWENIDLDVDRDIFELNVFSVVSLSRIAVRYFHTKGKGQIAVMSSVAGLIGAPFSASYTASKHSIHGYFDSLRYEKLGSKLQVTLLCPGPVFSNILAESFTANPHEKYGELHSEGDRRMSTERCARLCLVAIVNKLDEAWMALFPIVPLVYTLRYFPNLSKWVAKVAGARQFQRLRDNRTTVTVAEP